MKKAKEDANAKIKETSDTILLVVSGDGCTRRQKKARLCVGN